uniref:phage tail tape measure C-terminal domain-containing protein n=1 Tax=Escherichia coli TaxID=562 RepID=UPI00202067F0
MDVKITILQVDVANLRPNTWNTNSVGAQNFEKLKGSIEKLGFFKPILARELEDGFFEILGGEHRWRAAIEQGISTVPVLSVGKISDVVAKQMSLVDTALIKETGTATQKLALEYESLAEQIESTWTDLFSGLTDVLTDFVINGKMSFSSLSQSILKDITNMVVKSQITLPLMGTVAKLAMRQPFVLFKGLTFQKLCLPGAFRPGD